MEHGIPPKDHAQAYVYPGQVLAARERTVATTILGTCVAVCLFDPGLGIGGLNHFMLPRTLPGQPRPGTFGDVATHLLRDELCSLGAAAGRMVAKVFGGRSPKVVAGGQADLGEQNVAVAFESLDSLGIPVVAQDVGTAKSRKLVFHTHDGRAWVRHF
jgi:chemotaxis protein CheD